MSDCPLVTESVDHNDYLLVPEPVVGQCCPNIKKEACKHNGKVYKVGEKWPVEGNYCTTIECVSNVLGIQKLTNVENCEKNCELGWEYIPATSESKQCCGSCKPVACVVDGVIHKVGEEWSSPDHCVNFFCLNLNGSVSNAKNFRFSDVLPNFLIDSNTIRSGNLYRIIRRITERLYCRNYTSRR